MSILSITGEVAAARAFTFADLAAFADGEQRDASSVAPGRGGRGVRLGALLAAAGARGEFLLFSSSDGFTISVPRAAVEEAVVVYRLGEGELPGKEGGPCRVVVPAAAHCGTAPVDACANVKRLVEIRVTSTLEPDGHHH